jgi:hypothetical protein
MDIKKTIETPNGGVTFEGSLNSEELDVIIQVGLATLLARGALPMKAVDINDIANILPTDGDIHH